MKKRIIAVIFIISIIASVFTTDVNFYAGECLQMNVSSDYYTWNCLYRNDAGDVLYVAHGAHGKVVTKDGRRADVQEYLPELLDEEGIAHKAMSFMTCYTSGTPSGDVKVALYSRDRTYCVPTPWGVFLCNTRADQIERKVNYTFQHYIVGLNSSHNVHFSF